MKIINYYFILLIHKKGLCKPFHTNAEDPEHYKGWCPMMQYAYELFVSSRHNRIKT